MRPGGRVQSVSVLSNLDPTLQRLQEGRSMTVFLFAIHRSIVLLKLDYDRLSDAVTPYLPNEKASAPAGTRGFFIPPLTAHWMTSCRRLAAGRMMLPGPLCLSSSKLVLAFAST